MPAHVRSPRTACKQDTESSRQQSSGMSCGGQATDKLPSEHVTETHGMPVSWHPSPQSRAPRAMSDRPPEAAWRALEDARSKDVKLKLAALDALTVSSCLLPGPPSYKTSGH